MSALPSNSDINLFCYDQGVIDLDAEVSDGALDLDVAEQKLTRDLVERSALDQLGSEHACICAEDRTGAAG